MSVVIPIEVVRAVVVKVFPPVTGADTVGELSVIVASGNARLRLGYHTPLDTLDVIPTELQERIAILCMAEGGMVLGVGMLQILPEYNRYWLTGAGMSPDTIAQCITLCGEEVGE